MHVPGACLNQNPGHPFSLDIYCKGNSGWDIAEGKKVGGELCGAAYRAGATARG